MLFLYGTYSNTETKKDNIELDIEFSVPMSYLDNWKKCSIVANFFGMYQGLSYKKNKDKVISILSTITNELIENAVKFSSDKNSDVTVKLEKTNSSISIETCNIGNQKNMENLILFTEKLENNNPELIFMKNLEKNLNSNNKSELGLISIFKDYTNEIGFKITRTKEKGLYEIYTNIQIEDKKLATL